MSPIPLSGARRVILGLLALTLTATALPTTARALPDDPRVPELPELPTAPTAPFAPPASGFDWSVPERFTARSDGRLNWPYTEATGMYDPAYVRPASWPVDLVGCRTEYDFNHPTATQNTYEFVAADGQRTIGTKCKVRMSFAKEGTYSVRLKVTGSAPGAWTLKVPVKDLLIVSLGDSYASGEGNPEYARTGGAKYGDWVDDRCHRSSWAGPARAALELERSDPKTSVTFISFACSGGTINRNMNGKPDGFDPFAPGDPKHLVGSGILGPYRGAQPNVEDNYSERIPSQIDQLKAALAVGAVSDRRQVDALLLSAGGNDAGFGHLGSACVASDYCVEDWYSAANGSGKYRLADRVATDLVAMPARYDALAKALAPASLGIDIRRSYITEYPDPGTELRADSGRIEECEEILEDVMWGLGMEVEGRQWIRGWPKWSGDTRLTELGFARNVFVPALNGHIANASARHGWTMVKGISAKFQGHGYCVGANDREESQRFVQTAAMSATLQGPGDRLKTTGTLHPNRRGQDVFRDQIVAAASVQLKALTPDRGLVFDFDTTPATTTAAVSPTANAAGWHKGPVTVTVTGQAGADNPVVQVETRIDYGAWASTAGSKASRYVASGTHTVEYRSLDSSGRYSAIGQRVVRIDATPPTIGATRPGATQYVQGSTVKVSYTCSDSTSGIATCSGSQPVGSLLPTTLLGARTFAVTATDQAGNIASRTVRYTIVEPDPIDPFDPCGFSMARLGALRLPC